MQMEQQEKEALTGIVSTTLSIILWKYGVPYDKADAFINELVPEVIISEILGGHVQDITPQKNYEEAIKSLMNNITHPDQQQKANTADQKPQNIVDMSNINK